MGAELQWIHVLGRLFELILINNHSIETCIGNTLSNNRYASKKTRIKVC